MKRILLPLLLLAAPAAMQAQTAPAAGPPSTATAGQMAAAEDLLVAMNAEDTYYKSLDAGMMPRIATLPALAAHSDSIRAYVHRMVPWGELKPDFLRMYTEMFTEAELRQLAAFYRTPVGGKMIRLTPQMATRSMSLSEQRLSARMPEFMDYIRSLMGEGPASPPAPPTKP
ncbi:MAG TPA: DUF2059 domain-containing protein [Longimicrobiaceae bacterium]|jgi:hypothetical protein|nr:DUF2059 domain-containing protein [Longimicrobiaceae bacterium]